MRVSKVDYNAQTQTITVFYGRGAYRKEFSHTPDRDQLYLIASILRTYNGEIVLTHYGWQVYVSTSTDLVTRDLREQCQISDTEQEG